MQTLQPFIIQLLGEGWSSAAGAIMSQNICMPGACDPNQLHLLDSWCPSALPHSPPGPPLFGRLWYPHLQVSSHSVLLTGRQVKLCSVYEDSHPFRTICQLLSGHRPGAGNSLTPAMPQQHCLLGAASPCQLLIYARVSFCRLEIDPESKGCSM